MSDARDAEEGVVKDDEKAAEKDVTPAGDAAALIGKIAEQFTPNTKVPDDVSTDDDEAENHVDVEEVAVEKQDDPRFLARIERIAKQAEHVFKSNGPRGDTMFYKIVLAGNVRVVSHVRDLLAERGKADVVDWLLMRSKLFRRQTTIKGDALSNTYLLTMQVALFVLFSFISLVCSPAFYILHSFTTAVFGVSKHRLAASIHLPLAFAAFSQDEDMMKYFLLNGVSIKHSDQARNNVFHYIADLSSESSDRAMEIFSCLVKFINNQDVVKLLIGKKRNSAGLTALEYAAKFGSPQLLTQMLNYPGLLQHTAFVAGKEDVSFGSTETEEDRNDEPVEAITKQEYVDVTMYEDGGFTNLSTLLNLLSDRDVIGMSKEDLSIFNRMAFVGKWISLKTKQMVLGVLAFQVSDIIVTVFLIVLLMNGLGSDPFSASESNIQLEVMLKEIHQQGQNESHVFKNKALESVIQNVQSGMEANFLSRRLAANRDEIFNTASVLHPQLYDYYNRSIDNFDLDREDTPDWVTENLFDTLMKMPQFQSEVPRFIVWHHLPDIITQYSQSLFDVKPHLINKDVDIRNREFIEAELEEFYKAFVFTADNITIVPSESFDFWEFQQLFCVKKQFFTKADLEETELIPPEPNVYHSSCGYQALMELANGQCENLDPAEIYDMVHVMGSKKDMAFRNVAEVVFQVIVALAWFYIFLDIIERMAFIYTCVANHTKAMEMVFSVLSKKVPGSYMRKQINMVAYLAFICRNFVVVNGNNIAKSYDWSRAEVDEFGNFFLVIGLVFRFIMHIHALRLVPGIGHFVITTFMMGTNLVHFSAVYCAVVFIFAIIFHILIEDPECPVKKYDGFTAIITSMFSIFKLTFGHGEFDAYYTTTPVMLTYTLYTVIVGLLLMNLIIAIMSTTATDIMADPWKEILWRMEWLDEALAIEFTFSLVAQPLRSRLNIHGGFWTHNKAGFEVIEIGSDEGKEHRIFIEVFHCKALEKDG